MGKISIGPFKGTIPKLSALLLQQGYGQVAESCYLESGKLESLRAPKEITRLTILNAVVKSMFLWRVGDKQLWLRFRDFVTVIKSPIADDAYSRIYWSGDSRMGGEVLYSYTPAVYASGTEFPANFFKLGIPAPSSAPKASINGAPPENPDDDVRIYVYTYVGKLGEEGPPSLPSDRVIVANDGASVTVGGMSVDLDTSTGREIQKIRIYRTLTGSYGATFQFVAEIPASATEYIDEKTGDELGEVLPSATWDPPRKGMQGLGITTQGIAYGFTGKIFCPSELFKPYAWPRDYEFTTFDDIVAVGHYDANFIIATTGVPAMLTGTDPSSLSTIDLPINEACVSARSMVSMGQCAIYASPNGLVRAAGSSAELVTKGFISKEQWEKLNPSSIHAYEHDGKYLFFWRTEDGQKGGKLFDPANVADGFISFSHWFVSGHRDLVTDTLFLLDDAGTVWAWNRGEAMPYRWRSKIFHHGSPTQYNCARVVADDYDDITVRVYSNGELRHEERVEGPKAFRLPPDRGKEADWEVEIAGTSSVSEVRVAHAVRELAE